MEELDASEHSAPVWAVFGDLMSGLLGAFVLLLVAVVGVQMELTNSLQEEVKKRHAEEQRRMTLEKALAVPLASGRIRPAASGSGWRADGADLQPAGRSEETTCRGTAPPDARKSPGDSARKRTHHPQQWPHWHQWTGLVRAKFGSIAA